MYTPIHTFTYIYTYRVNRDRRTAVLRGSEERVGLHNEKIAPGTKPDRNRK